jgi:hypothetical protein
MLLNGVERNPEEKAKYTSYIGGKAYSTVSEDNHFFCRQGLL